MRYKTLYIAGYVKEPTKDEALMFLLPLNKMLKRKSGALLQHISNKSFCLSFNEITVENGDYCVSQPKIRSSLIESMS